MSSLSDRLLQHVLSFSFKEIHLPKDIQVLDPFNGPQAGDIRTIVTQFHQHFYTDNIPRVLMLGINPGRLGAGSTGIPFTDTKRCENDLGIKVPGIHTHEPSSDFFYRMINAAGGAAEFYSKVYVHAICPLGFVKEQPVGKPINLNYYDDRDLQTAVTPTIVNWLRNLIGTGMRTDVVICLGTGKNAAYFQRLNSEHSFFDRIIPVEHPRFIIQYKQKQMDLYIRKYLDILEQVRSI